MIEKYKSLIDNNWRVGEEDFKTEFKPCPRCKSKMVEWSNYRDLNVLSSHVSCCYCELNTFRVETVCFLDKPLVDRDYETTLMKYNAWVDTNPTQYRDDFWGEEND